MPTPEQEKRLYDWMCACRFIYNLCLEHRILSWYQYRKSVKANEQINEIKNLINTEGFEFLKDVSSYALREPIRELDKAFKKFWQKKAGYPRKKKRGKGSYSLIFTDKLSFHVKVLSKKKGLLKVPKMKDKVAFRLSRPIDGDIKKCYIKKHGQHYYVSFVIAKTVADNVIDFENFKSVGIDRGIVNTITTSNYDFYKLPRQMYELRERVKILQRRMRKKKRRSNRWWKELKRINKLRLKIGRIRRDFLHKVTKELANKYTYIAIEKLDVQKMTESAKGTIENPGKNVKAKSALNREISFQGWSFIESCLRYKLKNLGGELISVSPEYTSQECSECGYTDKKNRKGLVFKCLACNYIENADVNAAKNILNRAGLAQRARGEEEVALLDEARTTA